METSKETPTWIPTSFAGTSGTGDTVTFQSAPIVPALDDQSFDAISRQKLNTVEQTTPPKTTTEPPISMFEDDTRSSWSGEPPKQTPIADEDLQNSLEMPDSNPDQSIDKAIEDNLSIVQNQNESQCSKPQNEEPQGNVFAKPQQEESQDNLFIKPQEESLDNVFTEQQKEDIVDNTFNKHEDESIDNVFNKHEDESADNVFIQNDDESIDNFLSKNEDESADNIFDKQREESVDNKQQEGESQDIDLIKSKESDSLDVESFKPSDQDLPKTGFTEPQEEPMDISETEKPTSLIENSLDSVSSSKPCSEPQSNGFHEEKEPQSDNATPPSKESPTKNTTEENKTEDETLTRDFPPEKLFEYMWPQENGEFFMLMEHVCDYLGLKSFRRKHLSTMSRRPVDFEEKQFLRDKDVVTEMQCDLGLTAIKSEEVLELMSRDYPDHYAEYIKVLRERQQQSISEKHKEFVATNADKTKMVDLVRKAVQSAAEYNAHLNQERREERRSCMDLQTYTIHYPRSSKPKVETNTKMGKYPVALLPGQFQDYYKEYSPDELKYLPLNTVLYGPMKELQGGEEVSSDSEDSSASDGSCSSSSHEDSSSESEEKEKEKEKTEVEYKPKVKPNALCKVCKKGSDANKEGELVHCADCDNSAHPACIELSPEVVEVLRTYPWQCTDCKVCSQCTDPNDEDKMLFCDTCDRGYHTFCVGLKALPMGKWVCRRCGACSGCGATRPGDKAQWHCEGGESGKSPKILCQTCFKKKR